MSEITNIPDYEKLRQSNIERNSQFLKSIGIDNIINVSSNSATNSNKKHLSKERSKKAINYESNDDVGIRRSSRIALLPVTPIENEVRYLCFNFIKYSIFHNNN